MKRSSVRPSVQSIDRSSGARRVYCRVPCGQEISIDSDVQLAPSLSSKCGQCRVDSRRRRLDADLFTGKHVSVLSFRFRHPLTTKRNRRCDFRVSVCVGPTRRCRVWSTSWYRASTEVRDVHIYLHRSVTLLPPADVNSVNLRGLWDASRPTLANVAVTECMWTPYNFYWARRLITNWRCTLSGSVS